MLLVQKDIYESKLCQLMIDQCLTVWQVFLLLKLSVYSIYVFIFTGMHMSIHVDAWKVCLYICCRLEVYIGCDFQSRITLISDTKSITELGSSLTHLHTPEICIFCQSNTLLHRYLVSSGYLNTSTDVSGTSILLR